MARKVAVWLLAAALSFPPAGFAAAGEVLDAIRARGTIRVGTTGDYKPFTFRDAEGSYRGADIRMAERLAASMGVRVEWVSTVWARINGEFADRRFDLAVGGVTVQPARAKLGPFTPATFVDGKRPIVRCPDRDRLTSIEAINQPDIKVVVNPGAANELFARENFGRAQITVHRDNASVFYEILAGRADVMVTDGIEVDHQAHLHPELCPARVAQPFTRLEKAYWVQDDKELLAIVNAWLAGEVASGRWKASLDEALAEP